MMLAPLSAAPTSHVRRCSENLREGPAWSDGATAGVLELEGAAEDRPVEAGALHQLVGLEFAVQ
jgi:stage V sporulation protein SpoVS